MNGIPTPLGGIACAAAVLCYASFIWAAFRFFERGATLAAGMRLISVTALASMAYHLTGIVNTSSASPLQLLSSNALFALALLIFWWALATTWGSRLPIAFSAALPHRVVTTGPYRTVRHPIYLAYMLAWIAGASVATNAWAWLVPLVMGMQYLAAIRYEEKMLLDSSLASEYREYMGSVGMILPNPFKHQTQGEMKA